MGRSGWRACGHSVRLCEQLQGFLAWSARGGGCFHQPESCGRHHEVDKIMTTGRLRKITHLTGQKYVISGRLKRLKAFSAFKSQDFRSAHLLRFFKRNKAMRGE